MTEDEPVFRHDLPVKLIRHIGDDISIVQAAQVSVTGENTPDTAKAGLINYLMREKHGSPFEHNSMTFYVNAPIFVAREFMRHRIGWSYNEVSGRYSELSGEFYLPHTDRPLVNAGSSARPNLVLGSTLQYAAVEKATLRAAKTAWEEYQAQLSTGIAREVARSVLPVNVYTEFYATCNARSLLAFLSLRTFDEEAAHVSRPQYEIAEVAKKMEAEFEKLFPVTHAAYIKNRRVAP